MHTKLIALLLTAWTTFAPLTALAAAPSCADLDCCSQTQVHSDCPCCGCAPTQNCHAAQAPAPDQQMVARTAQLVPRIEVELFTLLFDRASAYSTVVSRLSRPTESPPIDTSPTPQARLCLWLI